MKVTLFLLFMIPGLIFATGNGFTCVEQLGPTGGGLSTLKLSKSADGTFEMEFTSAFMDGTNSKTTVLGKDLECQFSSIDPIASYCVGKSEIIPEKHLSNFLQSTKNVMTVVSPFMDSIDEYYDFRIAAPSVADEVLKLIDPLTFNPNNKSLKLSFRIRKDGLSGCKEL